ncbi:MAG: DNA cytosine methyltransferase [Thalassobaculaceae bacterium]|uniref:DNA cytosine methyltransferase n=1 Tax=Roseitalea porphyridii TaxID=1852022 RepID=UPI0032EC629D
MAEVEALQRVTGWTWDTRELASFLASPRQSSLAHSRWRKALASAMAESSGLTEAETTRSVDLVTARIREIIRILDADPLLSGPRLVTDFDEASKPTASRDVLERINLADRTIESLGSIAYDRPEELVSPDLSEALARVLGRLASVICLSEQPDCGSCSISRLCGSFREASREAAWNSDQFTVVDLFCGAGGMSKGFEAAGFRIERALEIDEVSARTFLLNHPQLSSSDLIVGDITDSNIKEKLVDELEGGRIDVLVGGPPCQGFSKVGKNAKRALRSRLGIVGFRPEDDDRNFLFEEFIEVAMRLRPRVAVMENVPGMDTARKGGPSFMSIAASMLQSIGYSTAIWEIDASSFGVPQRRVRKFLVAALGPVAPAMPVPDYRGQTRYSETANDLLPPITLGQAISDLPPVGAGRGDEVTTAHYLADESERALKHYVTAKSFPIRNFDRILVNHRARYNNSRDLELFSILEQGENGYDAVFRYGRDDLMRYRKDAFHDKYYRLKLSEPSRTVVAHLKNDGNGYIHPDQVRSLTPREGARLQSFPDSYWFTGTQGDQWRQIGNAVPPLLAYHIAGAVRRHLKRMPAQ